MHCCGGVCLEELLIFAVNRRLLHACVSPLLFFLPFLLLLLYYQSSLAWTHGPVVGCSGADAGAFVCLSWLDSTERAGAGALSSKGFVVACRLLFGMHTYLYMRYSIYSTHDHVLLSWI